MKRYFVFIFSLAILFALIPIAAATAWAAPAPSDTAALAAPETKGGISRGILLKPQEDGSNVWEFVTEDTSEEQKTREFKLNENSELLYTPVQNKKNLDPLIVYLEPKYPLTQFEAGDIFVIVINESGQQEPLHCRLSANGKLLARIVPIGEANLPFGVWIDINYLYLDEAARREQELALAAENKAKQEAEEAARLAAEQAALEQKTKDANKDALFEAINWDELKVSGEETSSVLLAVELSKNEDDGLWIVKSAEVAQISALTAISAWVLCAAVFLALILSIVLFVIRRKAK
jgi:hypothetical protein